MAAQLWAIGSGKGGVGKTFFASNLSIAASRMGKSSLLVDFDLSGGNVHTFFGITSNPKKTLKSFFDGSEKVPDLITSTNIPKVSIIQGISDDWGLQSVTVEQVQRLIEVCKTLDYDFVMFDLGTGSGPANMEVLKNADEKILLVDNEPASVEKLYRFTEALICASLREQTTAETFQLIQTALREYRARRDHVIFSFRDYLNQATGFSIEQFEKMLKRPMHLVVNSCRSRTDYDLGPAIRTVVRRYYDLNVNFLGSLDYDNAAWQSTRKKEPVLTHQPFNAVSAQFLVLIKGVLASTNDRNFSATTNKSVI